jgi:DNA replication protein DnaC
MPPKSKKPKRADTPEGACPDCGGSGYILTEEGARPCHCLRRRRSERYLEHANIPPRFAGKSIESFKADRNRALSAIREIAKAYVSGFTPRTLDAAETSFNGLLFIGGVGSGKTHMAVAILRAVIERGFTGRYCNVVDLLDDLRASYQPNAPQSGQEIIDAIVDVDLLVLDDLGAEAPTGWVHDRLYQIVNRRYEESHPTIITTNLSLDELGEQVGQRITSRLCEMCQRVDFPDQDWRRKRLAEQARRG